MSDRTPRRFALWFPLRTDDVLYLRPRALLDVPPEHAHNDLSPIRVARFDGFAVRARAARQVDLHRRAVSYLRIDLHMPARLFDEAVDLAEPKSGATSIPGPRFIEPSERSNCLVRHNGWNAWPCIINNYFEPNWCLNDI